MEWRRFVTYLSNDPRNKLFANTVTMGKVSHAAKMRMQTLREQGFGAS